MCNNTSILINIYIVRKKTSEGMCERMRRKEKKTKKKGKSKKSKMKIEDIK